MPMEIQQTLNDKAQARREDGQLLILTPNNGAAAGLSTLPLGLSAGEVTNNSSPLQVNGELFRPEDEYLSILAKPEKKRALRIRLNLIRLKKYWLNAMAVSHPINVSSRHKNSSLG